MASLLFSKTHEWVRVIDDKTAFIGISNHAQHNLGDIVFIELPSIDTTIKAGQEIGVIESIKAAADLYAPISGKIVAVNKEVCDNPSLINYAAEDKAWLLKIKITNSAELDNLSSAEQYMEAC